LDGGVIERVLERLRAVVDAELDAHPTDLSVAAR
jgi:hypothetical protein